jgi:hypothetical protein
MRVSDRQTETLSGMIPPCCQLFAHWLNFKKDKIASDWLK